MDQTAAAIDLNCDLGEGFGAYRPFPDEELLDLVTSANVACGFHAGDPLTMDRTVGAAAARGVRVGAHISYPDLVGFGRRHMQLTREQLVTDTVYQLGAVAGFCRHHDVRLFHVKPHGALYNRLSEDPEMSAWLAEAVAGFDPGLQVVLRAGSPGIAAVAAAGVSVLAEGFCDRGYLADGSLAPRGSEGALVESPPQAGARAVAIATAQPITDVDGGPLLVSAGTLCIHSDTPGAVGVARAVRDALAQAGIGVRAPD